MSKSENWNSYYRKTRACKENVVQAGVKTGIRTIRKIEYARKM